MKARLTTGTLGLGRGGKMSAQLFIISSGFSGAPRLILQLNCAGFCAPSGVSWIQVNPFVFQAYLPLGDFCEKTTTLWWERISSASVGSGCPDCSVARLRYSRARS